MTTAGEARVLSGRRERSGPQIFENARRVASGLARLGLRTNDAVAVMLRNDFAHFEASIGAALAGANAVPINWHAVADELAFQLRDIDARVLVLHADLLPAIRAAIPSGVTVLVVATPPEVAAAYAIDAAHCAVPVGELDWDRWLAGFEPAGSVSTAMRTSVIYTSGTTGRPKGVVREPATGEQAEALDEMARTIFGLDPAQPFRTVLTGPMYHAAPNVFGLAAIRMSGLVVLQPRFDAEALLALVEQHRITHLHMVPIMFVRLLKLPDAVRRRYDLSSLRFVTHAAAPCPVNVKRRMIEWWGPIVHEYYGGTETGGAIFHGPEEALRKPGTVGRPWSRSRVAILDEQGRAVPAGTPGLVYLGIRGLPDFTYRNRPEERAAIERDGLVTCGDIGWLDEEGYLFLCDRAKDMVISGGVNIYPAEIEAALLTMPGVHDCAVFGIPDEEYGESLCAHIEPEPGATLDAAAVAAHLRTRIAGYKIPRRIVFEQGLPREDSGKIFKRRLREPYWEGRTTRI